MSTPTTFWRLAGVSYIQYVTKAASTVRACLKEPAKTKAAALESFNYNSSVYSGGNVGPKVNVTSVSQVGRS